MIGQVGNPPHRPAMLQAEGTGRVFSCVVEELMEGLVSLADSINSLLLFFYQLKHWKAVSCGN